MGTGYVRNDTSNNIADGNVIDAADFDGEFDSLQAAMHATTGHNHDGTTGGGGPISKVGPTLDVEATATALKPRVDNTVDLGSATLEYKDLYLDGTAHIDTLDVDVNASVTGTLTVTGATSVGDLSVSGTFTPTGSLDVTGVDTDDLIVNTSVSSDLVPLADSAYDLGDGISPKYWANAYIDAITTTGNVTVGGNIIVTGTVDGEDIQTMRADITALEAGGLDGGAIKTLYEAEADTNAYTDAEKTKLSGIETGADVTDTTAVLNAGALMDSECANVAALKAINQGLTTTSAAQFGTVQTLTGAVTSATSVSANTFVSSGTSMSVGTNLDVTGNITVGGTVDGADVGSMNTKLAGIASGADVTSSTNVNSAGAVMESDFTGGNLANCKALNQSVAIGSSPSFGNLSTNITGNQSGGSVSATTITGSSTMNVQSGQLYVTGSGVGVNTTSTPPGELLVASDSVNGVVLRGVTGTNGCGLSWQDSTSLETMQIDISDTGNVIYDLDATSAKSSPYHNFKIKTNAIFRIATDGIKTGQFATDPWAGTLTSHEGCWIGTDGQLTVGTAAANPIQLNKINATDGIFINFRYDSNNGGNITTSGGTLGFTQVSDGKLKENVVAATGFKEVVKGLALKEFNWKADPTKKKQKGFIAQDVQAVVPEAVSVVDENDGTLGINYLAMFPHVVGALKEALEKIDELETRIEALEARP